MFNKRTILMSDWMISEGENPSRVTLSRYEGAMGRIYYSTHIETINPDDWRLASFQGHYDLDADAAMADYMARRRKQAAHRQLWSPSRSL